MVLSARPVPHANEVGLDGHMVSVRAIFTCDYRNYIGNGFMALPIYLSFYIYRHLTATRRERRGDSDDKRRSLRAVKL